MGHQLCHKGCCGKSENYDTLKAERNGLIQTLATERNNFGKRETELMSERDRLKADVEDLIWNLAGCSTFAMGYGLNEPFDETKARPAMRDTLRCAKDRDVWKAKAKEAIELSQEMIAYHYYDDNKPDYFNQKYEWEGRLAKAALKEIENER